VEKHPTETQSKLEGRTGENKGEKGEGNGETESERQSCKSKEGTERETQTKERERERKQKKEAERDRRERGERERKGEGMQGVVVGFIRRAMAPLNATAEHTLEKGRNQRNWGEKRDGKEDRAEKEEGGGMVKV
jgi:hypothetical protein